MNDHLPPSEFRLMEEEDHSPIICPRCKQGHIVIEQTIYKLPKEDESMLLMLVKCDHCDMLIRDVIPLNTQIKPGKYTYRVVGGDLSAKIFRSPKGYLEIPEFGIEIEPGPDAEFIVTNVEGILERSIYATEFLLRNNPENSVACELIPVLQEAKQGKQEFTVIVRDSSGGSYITHEDLTKVQFEECTPRDAGSPDPEREEN